MNTFELRPDCFSPQPSVDHPGIVSSQIPKSNSSITTVAQNSNRTENHYESRSEQVEDTFQETSTKRISEIFFLHLLVTVCVISTIVALIVTIIGPGKFTNIPGSCHPDGIFRYSQRYSPWAISGLFQITFGFGSMSFSEAKLIDVTWDLLIGRGGCLLSFLIYTADTDISRPMASGLHCVLGIHQVVSAYHGTETSFL